MTESVLVAAVVAGVISLLGVVFSTLVPLRSEVLARKRDRYAEAVGALVQWFELPYRVARRVDDQAETLKPLIDSAHDLQVALVMYQTWIAGESATVHRSFSETATWVKAHCRLALTEAWERNPNPRQMNIGDLGLSRTALEERVRNLEYLIGLRFGWNRLRLVRRFGAWKEAQKRT